eukprot:8876134-Pyramimonas_sp.AAC.1
MITLIPTKRIKAKESWEQSKEVENAILTNGQLKDKVVQAFANQVKNDKNKKGFRPGEGGLPDEGG